jgi:dTDP-4-dehydrorhamnose 3,5-epimerase
MGKIMKGEVFITPLKRIFHPKGEVFHALKKSDMGFNGFGEAYFTSILYGETKGWKRHSQMSLNLIVPVGMVRFYIHDKCKKTTLSYDLGCENYARLSIPPGLWVAFHGLGRDLNLILNIASIEHDQKEASNVPLSTFHLAAQS